MNVNCTTFCRPQSTCNCNQKIKKIPNINNNNKQTTKMFLDTNARGLERCPVQWHGKDKSLGRIVFCGSNDIRQLCAV